MDAAVNQFIRLPDYLSGRGLFAAAFFLILCCFLGKLARRARLPEITGYIAAAVQIVLTPAAVSIALAIAARPRAVHRSALGHCCA